MNDISRAKRFSGLSRNRPLLWKDDLFDYKTLHQFSRTAAFHLRTFRSGHLFLANVKRPYLSHSRVRFQRLKGICFRLFLQFSDLALKTLEIGFASLPLPCLIGKRYHLSYDMTGNKKTADRFC